MAVLPAHRQFLDACHRHGALQSPVVALGSQQYLGQPGETLATVLADRYGVTDYRDADLNGDARIRLDLSQPLPDHLHGVAGTVLDSGTLEHIFDVAQALRNAHELLSPGGFLIALASTGWYGHGFYNLDPRIYRTAAAANGWEPIVEGWFLRVRLPRRRKRFVTVLTRDGDVRPRARLWTDRLLNRTIPTGLVYLGCYRKMTDAPFVDPQDVFGDF